MTVIEETSVEIEAIDAAVKVSVSGGARHPLDHAALVGREAVTLGAPVLLLGLEMPEDLCRASGDHVDRGKTHVSILALPIGGKTRTAPKDGPQSWKCAFDQGATYYASPSSQP